MTLKSYDEMSPEDLRRFIEDHTIMALVAADRLHPGDRESAEAETWQAMLDVLGEYETPVALAAEDTRRRQQRLMSAIHEPEG